MCWRCRKGDGTVGQVTDDLHICERCALAVHRGQITMYDTHETPGGVECNACLIAEEQAKRAATTWAECRRSIALAAKLNLGDL